MTQLIHEDSTSPNLEVTVTRLLHPGFSLCGVLGVVGLFGLCWWPDGGVRNSCFPPLVGDRDTACLLRTFTRHRVRSLVLVSTQLVVSCLSPCL